MIRPALSELYLVSSNQHFGRMLRAGLEEYLSSPIELKKSMQAVTVQEGTTVVLLDCHRLSLKEKLSSGEQVKNWGGNLILLNLDPDAITIGPLMSKQSKGCLYCADVWSRNEYSSLSIQARPKAPWPSLTAAFHPLLAALLSAYLSDNNDCLLLVLNTLTQECITRRFVPHPECPYCQAKSDDSRDKVAELEGPRPKGDIRTFRAARTVDIEALRECFHDSQVGLVRYLVDHYSSSYMPMSFASFLADGTTTVYENGYGRTADWQSSRLVAVLESLERFCGYMPRGKTTRIRASYASVGVQGVDPRSFILHSEQQQREPGYLYPAYSEDLEFNWVWGYSLRQHKPVLVPEQFVYYRLPEFANIPINRFVYEVSNGCSVGSSLEEAALHGLFEVIERDAYLATWYLRHAPVRLDLSSVENADIRALVALVEAQGYKLFVFDLGLEFEVAAVWAMIINPRPGAPVKTYCAAGASIDPEKAIFSALVEVCSSMPVYEQSFPSLRERAAAMVADPSLVRSMEDHVLLYSHEDAFDRFDFLFRSERSASIRECYPHWYRHTPCEDLYQDLMRIVERLSLAASDVIVVDQSFPAMRDLGLHCVKVLVPGLLPVTFGHQYRRISHDRLEQFASWRGIDFDPKAINPHPHNFP